MIIFFTFIIIYILSLFKIYRKLAKLIKETILIKSELREDSYLITYSLILL